MSGIAQTWIGRCGEELDRFLNVALLGGAVGETISLHAATAAQDGKRWGCLLCAWLSATVERDHCPKVLAGASVSTISRLIAGAQLLAVALALSGAFWLAVLR